MLEKVTKSIFYTTTILGIPFLLIGKAVDFITEYFNTERFENDIIKTLANFACFSAVMLPTVFSIYLLSYFEFTSVLSILHYGALVSWPSSIVAIILNIINDKKELWS